MKKVVISCLLVFVETLNEKVIKDLKVSIDAITQVLYVLILFKEQRSNYACQSS